jgi:hypothetical protein
VKSKSPFDGGEDFDILSPSLYSLQGSPKKKMKLADNSVGEDIVEEF